MASPPAPIVAQVEHMLAGSPTNAQVALLASATTFSSSLHRHNTDSVLRTADKFKDWLDEQDSSSD